jgi:selenide,water dikinase
MPNACTDITGFGLLGHACEMAERSGVHLRISADKVPLLPGAFALARAGQKAGGLGRNRDYFATLGVRAENGLDPDQLDLFYDPQTSGGLLFSLPPDRAARLHAELDRRGLSVWEIGRVDAGSGIDVVG